jgi:hypothetical protein
VSACYARGVIGRALGLIVVAGCAVATAPNGTPGDAPASSKADAPSKLFMDAPSKVFMDAPAMMQVCATSVTCATATVLPGLGGDEDGAGSTSASGYQAAWYSIRLSETDSGPFGDPMSIVTTLTSPSTAMFDLFVYVDTSNDDVDCTTATGTVTTSGTSESSNIEWGETGEFANDSDDSRTVSIEVRPKTGDMCSSSDTWTLSIETGVD